MTQKDSDQIKIVIIGGGPGGYEAANYAASSGAEVVLIENRGLGGSAVLTDVVPSKALIAAADAFKLETAYERGGLSSRKTIDLGAINKKILKLARSQSADILESVKNHGVHVIKGFGKLRSAKKVDVFNLRGELVDTIFADAILLAVGGAPREFATVPADGQHIFNWKQIHNLKRLPEHLVIIGSGITGAEFASAFKNLGAQVTLVSSRQRVLPGEDKDAAKLLEEVFKAQGMNVLPNSRAQSVERKKGGVVVTLDGGTEISGSHCLVCVGSFPNTKGIGLEKAGVELTPAGHIKIDSVCRTTAAGVYAAGDCTGVNTLASVAAIQGRLAVAHIVGAVVKPLNLTAISSNIFTTPEIASVGVTEAQVGSEGYRCHSELLPLHTNARAKILGIDKGFVKIISRLHAGTVIGAVVVAPSASELIYPLAVAVQHRLGTDDLAYTSTVYPSLSGSLAETARRAHLKN